MTDDDRQLVARMLEGEEAAFERYFTAVYARVYRFALARVHERRDVADDIAQQTLCRACRKLASYRGEASLLTWTLSICRREIAEWWRVSGSRDTQPVPLDDDPEIRAALESLTSPPLSGPDHVAIEQIARLVHAVLDRLPLAHGQVLEMKYLAGLSVVEIAARLQSTPKAIESLLTRARASFQDGLLAMFGTHPRALRELTLLFEPDRSP